MTDENMVTLDGEEFFDLLSKTCSFCFHKAQSYRHICAAFTNGIPLEIWCGENDHSEPWPGDGDIRFKRREE